LGLPATEDKLLQAAVARILNAIYEQDFLPCSYGYRQGRGALDAVKELSFQLQYQPYHDLVEADIQGFFDHIDHGQLLAWLGPRGSMTGRFCGLSRSG
jgi:RNA-directed DNA polymerase